MEFNKAVLIGVKTQTISIKRMSYSMEELAMLADTAGMIVINSYTQNREKPSPRTYFGKGKITELAADLKETLPQVVIVDDELSPSQQKNLERDLRLQSEIKDLKIIDRTELILYIFAQRAQTSEARLQVELASLKYQLPRLTRMWGHLHRQVGQIGTRGPGETQLEVDKRRLREKVTFLNKKINEIKAQRTVARKKRQTGNVPTASIIGYTNAGKSTLLNSITGADVFAENKLFATLDTTSRVLKLDGNQEIVVTDTVGFINKLPHNLVNAFRATLEETIHADFFIHLVDISSPDPEYHISSVEEVLKELKCEKKPMITVFNKIDNDYDENLLNKLQAKYQPSTAVSVKENINVEEIYSLIEEYLSTLRKTIKVLLPYSKMDIVEKLHRITTIIEEEYRDNGIFIEIEISKDDKYIIKDFIVND